MEFNYIKEKTASITGHRPKSLPWGYNENNQSCKNFKIEVSKTFEKAIQYGLTTFLTGMAEGFDMICAELLIDLRKIYKNIKIVAILPCLEQYKNWKPSQQQRYKKIIASCDDIIFLNQEYTPTCMFERNKFMVEHSSVCIACWDGRPSGTSYTIRLARKFGNKIKLFNPKNYDCN